MVSIKTDSVSENLGDDMRFALKYERDDRKNSMEEGEKEKVLEERRVTHFLPIHARGPAEKGMKASFGQSPRNLLGSNSWGFDQYFAVESSQLYD